MPVPIALVGTILSLLPSVAGLLTDNKRVQKAADIAGTVGRTISGQATEEQAYETIRNNPELLLRLEQEVTQRLVVEMEAEVRLFESETDRLRSINESLQAEVVSGDPYVRRMRPTFGYIMAFTWAAQMLAIAWTILDNPSAAGLVLSATADLTAMWTVGLSVLGIYVYKRSEEKKNKQTEIGPGTLQGLMEKFKGNPENS